MSVPAAKPLLYLKPAGWIWASKAMLFYRRADQFRQQRFGKETRFGMISCCGGDWAAVAMDEVFPIFFLKGSRAAQLFENAQCSINSLLSRLAAQLRQMFIGHGLTSGTHSGAQTPGFDLP
jgi:hypothetical protein